MKVALCWVECTPMDDNVHHLYRSSTGDVKREGKMEHRFLVLQLSCVDDVVDGHKSKREQERHQRSTTYPSLFAAASPQALLIEATPTDLTTASKSKKVPQGRFVQPEEL